MSAEESFWESELLEEIIYYGFLILALTVPLIFSRNTYDQFDLPKITFFRVVSLAIIALFAGKVLLSNRFKLYYHNYLFILGFFLVAVLIATVFSIHIPTAFFGKYRRFEGSFTFLLYALLVFAFIQIFRSQTRLQGLLKVTAVAGAVSAFYGLLQYFRLDPYNWGSLPFEAGRSFSTMGNPALFGGLMAVVFPISFCLALASRKVWETTVFAFSSFLTFFALLTSFNRAGWIATGVALFFILSWLIYFSIKKQIKLEVLVNFLVFTALLAAFVGLVQYQSSRHPTAPMNIVERAESIARVEEGSLAHRREIWKAALGMIQDRPFFGWGPDTFRIMSRVYQTRAYTLMTPNVVADNAHCFPLQLASGSGLVGFGSFYLFLLFLLIEGARTLTKRLDLKVSFNEEKGRRKKSKSKRKQPRKEKELDSLVQIVNLGILTSFFAYTVFLMASVSIVGSSLIWWLTIGGILSQSNSLKRLDWVNTEKSFPYRSLVAIVLLVLLAVGMVVSINHYRADYEMVRGLRLLSRSDLEGFLALEKSVKLNPYNEHYLSEMGRSYLTAARYSGSKDYYKKAEESLKKAIQTNPKETDSYVFLADLYRLEGAVFGEEYFNKSIETANDALKICGYLYSAYFVRGLSYLALKNWPKAIGGLKQALEFKPDLSLAWYGLGQAYREEGNNKMAKEALEKAVELEPDNEEFKKALNSLTSSVTTKS